MIGKKRLIYLLFVLILAGCKRSETSASTPYNPPLTKVSLTTDKARYNPGDVVQFAVDKELPSTAKIRYRHLNKVIREEDFSGKSWQWTVPGNDFTGYMVDIYETIGGKEVVLGSIGVDVSSDWSRFPRYGFLSRYSQMSNSAVNAVVKKLNRDHINGIQFYDCEFKHHLPLAGTTANPDTVWTDIAGRDIYMSTLKKYLNAVHNYNMEAMFYNLAYGALSDARADGVSDQWYLYTDRLHGTKDKFALPNPPFKSNIWLLDPSNAGWQQYIANKTEDFFKVFDFDGYHIDQLGNRDKNLYTYNGVSVNLPTTFESFIQAMHTAMPEKILVMNAVNQYGQREIA
ncbi:MAG TPA: cycloisomaltooligosaccharide glucanotransferase, partial [Bacteroidetes bacterium]|nr:cycloisomaltooligosaccharide glucanotransferase [Bacteroidota bacterium]